MVRRSRVQVPSLTLLFPAKPPYRRHVLKTVTSRSYAGTLAAGVVAVLIAGGLATASSDPTGTRAPARTASFLLGVRGAPDSYETLLGRLDPLTLEPQGRSLRIAEFHARPVFSPDRRRLAVGLSESPPPGFEPSGRVGLWIVDRAGLKVQHRVATGIAAEAAAWPSPHRILAYLQGETIAVIDAETGKVLRRRQLPTRGVCCFRPMVAISRGAAVLTAPPGQRGLALSLVDPSGGMRRVSLGRLRVDLSEQESQTGTVARAGSERVLASAPNAPLALVDTRSARKRYKRLPAAPSCPAGQTCRGYRGLIWLGRGRVAMNDQVSARGDGERHLSGRSWLIDLHQREARVISHQTFLTRGDGTLVAFGRGLTVLERDGRPRFSALRKHRLWNVQVKAGRIYALSDERRSQLFVLDAVSGKTLHRSRPFRGELILL